MKIAGAPRTVDVMINSVCNLSCPFCYGPDPLDLRELVPEDFQKMVSFLRDAGTEGIVVSGGEPTLRSDLPERLHLIEEAGLWMALQSNGTRRRQLAAVLPSLRWLALPLDTVRKDVAKAIRTSTAHVDTTLRAATSPAVVAAREAGMQLKISTVVTSANAAEMGDVLEVVKIIRPDVWKVHQFRPRGEGRLNREWLSVSDADFDAAIAPLSQGVLPFPVSTSRVSDSIGAYLIVNPDSTVLVTQEDHYLSFGQLIVDGDVRPEVYSEAVAHLNAEKHIANSLRAFPEAAYVAQATAAPAGPPRPRVIADIHLDRGGR